MSFKDRLEEMGRRLEKLLRDLPDHAGVSDTLDYVVGALYGLERAVDLKFVDRPGESEATYRPFLAKYVGDIIEGKDVNKIWLAGFYFNSAGVHPSWVAHRGDVA